METLKFFSHDSNARNDNKIIKLRQSKDGMAKYGCYWMLIEKLRDSKDYTLERDYNALAWEFRCDNAIVKSVVEEFGLFDFTKDSKCFYSKSLLNRMAIKEEKSKKAKKAAEIRWNKQAEKESGDCESNADGMQTHNKVDADGMPKKEKESKVNESKKEKDKKKNIPPVSEFLEYAKSLEQAYHPSLDFQIKNKYNTWVEDGWKDGFGNQIKNWKLKLGNAIPYMKKDFSNTYHSNSTHSPLKNTEIKI